MIAIAPIHLCLEGDSPLTYVKNKVLLFFYHRCLSKQNDSTKHDYNLEEFFPIIYKYMVLKICFLKYFEVALGKDGERRAISQHRPTKRQK